MRCEIDKDGCLLCYDNNGFQIKTIHVVVVHAIPVMIRNAKEKGDGKI